MSDGPEPNRPKNPRAARGGGFFEILLAFTRLGLTSFGGPVAHLGYFHAEFVERREWLSADEYADLVALCQFLPGPASSQVGFGLGMRRGGVAGGIAAWLGFTLPSAILLMAFAFGVASLGNVTETGWLRGLKIVAVPVVAHAVVGMATRLTPDRPRITMAIAAAMLALLWPTSSGQIVAILLGGLAGWLLLNGGKTAPVPSPTAPVGRRVGAALLALFLLLLLGLPALREVTGSFHVAVADSFYRSGALVFGGGHVVLPLLQAEVVPPGWVDESTFTAGYGAAQAVPGPLFTFAAYLGATMLPGAAGIGTALVALIAVFLPSLLLLVGVLPFWERLRQLGAVRAALGGVNAAVVGILIAALYQPVWTSAIHGGGDLALALGGYLLLAVWRWPAWLVVLASAVVATILFSS